MKNITKEEYKKLAEQASPNTQSWKTIPKAFAIGGLICAIGQGFLLLYKHWGASPETASTWVSITLIFCSVLATGLKIYDNLAKHAGAGTLVPITGFANAVASPALEFKSEGLILGLAAKLCSIAGPVIVYGLAASVIYGIILVIFQQFIR